MLPMNYEFNSRETRCHILQPIAYNKLRKCKKRGAPIRSIREQFDIHCIAALFPSNHLIIPRPHQCSLDSYTMDYLGERHMIPSEFYHYYPSLVSSLIEFYYYMRRNGYWPFDYSVLELSNDMFALVDFSGFGYIHNGFVRFPKDKIKYSFHEVMKYFRIPIRTETPPPSSRPSTPRPEDVKEFEASEQDIVLLSSADLNHLSLAKQGYIMIFEPDEEEAEEELVTI